MNRLYRAKCITVIRENEELPFDHKPEHRDCVLDLDQVESFIYDEDHESEVTQVIFRSGHRFTIDTNFEMFNYIMSQFTLHREAFKA